MKKIQIILFVLAIIVVIVKIISYSYDRDSDFRFYANKIMFTVIIMNIILKSIQEKNIKYRVLLVLSSIIGIIGLFIVRTSCLR